MRRLASLAGTGDPYALPGLFTAQCRASCPGLSPFPLPSSGGYRAYRWLPRPGQGEGAVPDLARLLLSYWRVERIEVRPLHLAVLPRTVRLRASLRIQGLDAQRLQRVDQGLVDLTARQEGDAWKIHELRLAPLYTLLREKPLLRASRMRMGPATRAAGPEQTEQDLTVPGRVGGGAWSVTALDSNRPDSNRPDSNRPDSNLPDSNLLVAYKNEVLATRGSADRERSDAAGPRRFQRLLRTGDNAPVRVLVSGDVDGDGRSDLFVGSYGGRSSFWLNREGGLVPLAGFEVRGHVTAALLADLDGDQRLDLFVVRHGPPDRGLEQPGEPDLLLRGRGKAFGPAKSLADDGWGLAVCGGDLDGDGDIDLVVANEAGASRLYLNRGQGRLQDVSRAVGLDIPGLATACAVGDLDNDGRLDLVMGGRAAAQAHLFGRPDLGAPGQGLLPSTGQLALLRKLAGGDSLWLNRPLPLPGGQGRTCRQAATSSGRGVRPCADRGDPGFRLQQLACPGSRPSWSGWTGLLDHDADGDLDLLLLESGPRPEQRRQWWWTALGPVLRHRPAAPLRGKPQLAWPARLLLNMTAASGRVGGAGASTDIFAADAAPLAGLSAWYGSVGVASDQDGDGALELLLDGGNQVWTYRSRAVQEQDEDQGHGLTLRLVARSLNRDALGSRVELWAGGKLSQVREVGLSSGMPGGPPGHVHFGLGDALRAERVRVRWPDRSWQMFVDLPADRLVRLHQGGGAHWDLPRGGPVQEMAEQAPASSPAPEPVAPPASRLLPFLPRPLDLTVVSSAGPVPLSTTAGTASMVVLLLESPLPPQMDRHLCSLLRSSARRSTARVVGVMLRPRTRTSCLSHLLQATEQTQKVLEPLRGLLPLGVVIDEKGEARRWISLMRRVDLDALLGP